MNKIIPLALAAMMSVSIGAHAAGPNKVDPNLLVWKDVNSCLTEAIGKVVSAENSMVGGKPGVIVKAKPTHGSGVLRAGIQGPKASDFPVGSAFCKADFGAD